MIKIPVELHFEWDTVKNYLNMLKHGVSFEEAKHAFSDSKMIVARDKKHSTQEESRYYCIAKVKGGIITVRFTHRASMIRILGAEYWRKYKKLYTQQSETYEQ